MFESVVKGLIVVCLITAAAVLVVSPTGTWTVLIGSPDGRACLAAAGASWSDVSTRKPPV